MTIAPTHTRYICPFCRKDFTDFGDFTAQLCDGSLTGRDHPAAVPVLVEFLGTRPPSTPAATPASRGREHMTTLSSSYPVARKPHRCTSCSAWIPEGARYHRWVVRLEEGWDGLPTARECARCCDRYGRPIPAAEEAGAS